MDWNYFSKHPVWKYINKHKYINFLLVQLDTQCNLTNMKIECEIYLVGRNKC